MANLRRAALVVNRLVSRTSLPLCRPNLPSKTLVRAREYDRVICRYFSALAGDVIDVDFSNEESRRRLFNRSKQRGFLELDLVLGKWVDENIHNMDDSGIRSLVDILDLEMWKWVSGQDQPPEEVEQNPVFRAVHGKVTDNLNSYSVLDTRAIPGKPWVRGWDDIKRAKDAPITGNQ